MDNMNIRFSLAVLLGKTAGILARLAGSGGGALPGLVSQRIDPDILNHLAKQCSEGIFLVTGTNGKTTTSRMVAEMLGNTSIIHNRSGSNMTRGHIAAFLDSANWLGKIKHKQALLEVDEAVVPYTLQQLTPKAILFLNLFRDQLDRYGEVNTIAKRWKDTLQKHSSKTVLIINADDPNLAYMAQNLPQPVVWFGLDDSSISSGHSTSVVDAHLSPASGKPLHYSRYYLSHLGEYHDETGFSRPPLTLFADNININADKNLSTFILNHSKGSTAISLPLPGLYNVYNALAAASLGLNIGLTPGKIARNLSSIKGAFGRFETISYKDKEITLCLIKNPAGATEVLRTIALSSEPFSLGLFVHDNFADGQDVSWYWDTRYEVIANLPHLIVCSGLRASDAALRMKYTDHTKPLQVIPLISTGFEHLISQSPAKIYIASTYTATLELQTHLKQLGIKNAYWEE